MSILVACGLYYTIFYHLKPAHLWLTDSVIQYYLWLMDSVMQTVSTSSEHNYRLCYTNCGLWTLLYELLSL